MGLVLRDRLTRRAPDPSSTAECWVDREAAGCEFRDARLGKRFRQVLAQIGSAMGQSIPLVCQDWVAMERAGGLGVRRLPLKQNCHKGVGRSRLNSGPGTSAMVGPSVAIASRTYGLINVVERAEIESVTTAHIPVDKRVSARQAQHSRILRSSGRR